MCLIVAATSASEHSYGMNKGDGVMYTIEFSCGK